MSSGVRRRRKPGDGGLDEPLLAEHDDSASTPAAPPPGQRAPAVHERQIIVHQPFNVDAFIRLIVQRWMSFLRAMELCLRSFVGGSRASPEPQLSSQQAERLHELRRRIAEPYDPTNPQHVEDLLLLWRLTWPGVEAPQADSIKHEQWKAMGWQGEDPGTDFRGAGHIALRNLIAMATWHPHTYQRLLTKSKGARAAWEYPFAASATNVTFRLVELFGLRGDAPPSSATGRAFLTLLDQPSPQPLRLHGQPSPPGGGAFEECYVALFELLDATWLATPGVDYMQFNAVLKVALSRFEAALVAVARRHGGVADLRRQLGLAQSPGWADAE